MRFTTQKAALCSALLDGEVLSIMDGFKKLGITNLPREISRQVEQAFGVGIVRTKCHINKHGRDISFYRYRLVTNPQNIYIALMPNKWKKRHVEGLKLMRKYVEEHTEQEEYKGWMNEHERKVAKFYADQAAKRVISRCGKTTAEIVRDSIFTKEQIAEQKRKNK